MLLLGLLLEELALSPLVLVATDSRVLEHNSC